MPDDTALSALKAKIDPQQAAALARNAEIVASLGGPGEGIEQIRERQEAARAVWNEGGPAMAEQRDLTIPGPFRGVPCRLYKPVAAADMPLWIYLHGGGFRLGGPLSNDRQMREIAEKWGGAILSCDYVHVPEHRFPDPVDEIFAVLKWVSDNPAALGIDPDRIAIGGASAGASVAFGVTFEARDHLPELVKGVVSLYGVVDNNLDSESMLTLGNGDFMLTRDGVGEIYDNYVIDSMHKADARAFATKGLFSDLPPVFIAAAELDPIRDDSVLLADLIAEADQPVRLKVYPGVLHAFFGYSAMVDRAQELIADTAGFLTETLGT
ncbi:MAG: alpha/beta hydrolase fold domain-containing protein [Alphaproteobacteria bacterium]|jgi:acetyl esterase